MCPRNPAAPEKNLDFFPRDNIRKTNFLDFWRWVAQGNGKGGFLLDGVVDKRGIGVLAGLALLVAFGFLPAPVAAGNS